MRVSYLSEAPVYDSFSLCKYVSAGNSVMTMSMERWNRTARIRKIDSEHYMVISSGEVKKYEHWENRADGKNSLLKSVNKLRWLINANCTESENLLWITLTYAENMTDVKRLYRDWDKFWKRLKYHFKSESIDIPEYIDVNGDRRKQQGHILHPSHLHFVLLQVFVKLALGHHGVVIAAVPEGDEQFAVHGVNGLLLEAFAKAVRALSRKPISKCFRFLSGKSFFEAAVNSSEQPIAAHFHRPNS